MSDNRTYSELMLEAIFGGDATFFMDVHSSLGDSHSVIASMNKIYCLVIFVALTWYLMSQLYLKMVSAGESGQLAHQRYSDTLTAVRAMVSICAIMPLFKGYALCQVFIVLAAFLSTEAADQTQMAAEKHIYSYGSIGYYRPDEVKIQKLVSTMTKANLCAAASNSYYLEHPLYQSKYRVEVAEHPLTGDFVAGFKLAYENRLGEPICGGVEFRLVDDPYFGNTNAPTGSGLLTSMTSHQRALAMNISQAHQDTLVYIHNEISKSLTAGLVVPGQSFDPLKLFNSINSASEWYQGIYGNMLKGYAEELGETFDKKQNSFNSIAEGGWVFNGLSFLEKSKSEAFMSQLAREIPIATGPDYSRLENEFIKERFNRTIDIVDDLATVGANKQTSFSSAPGGARDQVESLKKAIMDDGDYEAVIGAWFSENLTTALIDTQFDFDHYDPLTNLQHFGHRLLNVGLSSYFLSDALDIAAAFTIETARENAAADTADFLAGGTVSGSLSAAEKIVEKVVTLLNSMAVLFIVVGSLLAYALPMLPFVMWTLAVLGWLMLCVAGFLAAPVWFAFNATPDGDGWFSDSAKQGWLTLVTIMVRPTVMVITWFIALLVMKFMGQLASIFLEYIPVMNSQSVTGLYGALVCLIFFLLFEALIVFRCTSLIYEVPDQLPLYYGASNTTANESIGENKANSMIAAWQGGAQRSGETMQAGKGGGLSSGSSGGSITRKNNLI